MLFRNLLLVTFACALTPTARATATGPRPSRASVCGNSLDARASVDQTYDRFVATALGAERQDADAAPDQRLLVGVRREYQTLFGRGLTFSEIAANLLRTGDRHDQRLHQAVDAYVSLTKQPTSANGSKAEEHAERLDERDERVDEVYESYQHLLNRIDTEGYGLLEASELKYIRTIEYAFAAVHGQMPKRALYQELQTCDARMLAGIKKYIGVLSKMHSGLNPSRVRRPSCFTGHMRVATPSGSRAIASLRVGDPVYSYDLATRHVVISLVTGVRHTPERTFGRLTDHAIEVTGEHRFFAGKDVYDPIARIGGEAALYGLNETDLNAGAAIELAPRTRGCYLEDGARATVTEISLGAGPHNYFVEGILVHNIKLM